ncbi:MAG: DUF6520 family protein [Aequorivita sp.]
MRTKILKFGMPMMAFLLAIVFVFATEKRTSVEEDSLITGYIGTVENCNVAAKNCSSINGPVCKYLGQTVHRYGNCSDLLFEWMP